MEVDALDLRAHRSQQLLAALGVDAVTSPLPAALLSGKGGVPSASSSLLLFDGEAAVVALAHALQAAYLPTQHLPLRAVGLVRGAAAVGVSPPLPPIPPTLFDLDVAATASVSTRLRYHDVPQLVTNMPVVAAQRSYPAVTSSVTASGGAAGGAGASKRYEIAITGGTVLASAALQRLQARGVDVVGTVESAQARVSEALIVATAAAAPNERTNLG